MSIPWLIASVVLGKFIIKYGGAFTTLTIMIQESVEYNKRGAATATNSFLKTLGQTIGVSVFGSIFNLYIAKHFTTIGITRVEPSNLYKSTTHDIAVTSEQIKLINRRKWST